MRGRATTKRRTLLSLSLVAALVVGLIPAMVIASEAPAGHGVLTVDTAPALDAEIAVDGVPRNVGQVRGLPLSAGYYEVCFAEVPGYLPPPCETVSIVEGQTTSLTGIFTAAGTLSVTTMPSELRPQVSVDGVNRDAAATTLPVAAGTREVCAAAEPGYLEVGCKTVLVPAGGRASVQFVYEEAPEPETLPEPEPELTPEPEPEGDEVSQPEPEPAPEPDEQQAARDGRISEGLVALYEFSDGSGGTVSDSAGVLDGMDLSIANPAATTWGEGTLRFDQFTIAATDAAPSGLYRRIQDTGEFTFEAWIEPANLTQNGPARILSLGKDISNANVVVGQGSFQGGSDLIEARHQRTGDYQLATAAGTLTTGLTHVVMTRTSDGRVSVYLDGQPQASRVMEGDPAKWDTSYRFAIGAELNKTRHWLGTYHLLAIYDAALTPDQITTNHTAGADADTPTPDPQPDPDPTPEAEPEPEPEPHPRWRRLFRWG